MVSKLEIHINDHEGHTCYNPDFIMSIMGTFVDDGLEQKIVIEGKFNSRAIMDSTVALNLKIRELLMEHEEKLKAQLKEKGLDKGKVMELLREVERLYRSPD